MGCTKCGATNMKKLIGKDRREVRDYIKRKAQVDGFERMSHGHKTALLVVDGVTYVSGMILCYLSGLWAHNNAFLHSLFG